MGLQVIFLQWTIFLDLLHSNSAQFSVERTRQNVSRLENITQDRKDDQDQLTPNVRSTTEKHKTVSDNIVQAEIRHALGNASKPSYIVQDGVLLGGETNITTDIKISTRKTEKEEGYHEHEGKTVHYYHKERHQRPLVKSPHLNSAADETSILTWSNKDDDGRTNTHKTMTGISENKTFIPQTFQIPKVRMPDLPLHNKTIHDFKKHDFKKFTDLTAGMKDFTHLKGRNSLTTNTSSPNPTTKMSENIDSYHMERTLKVQRNDMGHNRIVWYNTTTQNQSTTLPKNSGKQAHITLSNNIEKTTTSVPEGPKESRYGLNKWLRRKITTDEDGPRQRQSARDPSKWEYDGTFKSRINKSEPFVRKVSGHLTQGNRIKRQTPEPFKCRCPSCRIPGNTDPARNAFNVMFNKPGKVSSTWPGRLGECGMVNGIRYAKHDGPDGPNCINTGDNDPELQFAEYDLLKVYTMNEMELTRRDLPDDYDIPRMRNTNILVDGEVCFSYPPYADTSYDSHLRDITHKINCYKPTSGRWVRVRRRKDYVQDRFWYHILICELVVWVCNEGYFGLPNKGCSRCPPENQCQFKDCDNMFGCNQLVVVNSAINKPVTSSSILHGSPSMAIDGVQKDPDYTKCSATDPAQDGTNNRWWKVNMQTTYNISGVKVTSRQDCCGEQLRIFHVFVMKYDVDLSKNLPFQFICASNDKSFSNGESRDFNCPKEIVGTFVGVATPSPNVLQFCEVQVFGFEVTVLPPGDDCTRITASRGCAIGHVCIKGTCKVAFGGDCLGVGVNHCLDKLTCDKGLCVLALNEPCTGTTSSECQSTAICDSRSGNKCKGNIGAPCAASSDCKVGTSCDLSKKCKLPISANCANQDECPFRSSCQSGNTCKWNPGEACESTTTCQSGYICDTLSKCKKPIGSPCTQNTDCVGGASCQTSTCFCEGSGSSTCDPQSGRAGGPCSPTILCVTNSQCIDNKCKCNSGYEITEEFACKSSLGSTCQATEACVTGLVCSGSACKIEVGGICNGNSDCELGSVCEDGQCKLAAGSTCDQKKDQCGESSSCENQVCKLEVASPCNPGSDECKSGVKCSKTDSDITSICRLDSGQDCSGDSSTLCANGTVCEDGKICKLTFEGDCSSSRSTHCSKSTKCIAGTCKLAVGGECTADSQCETGSFCDTYLSQCRLQPGQPCAAAFPRDMCASGGKCDKAGGSCACSGNGTTVLNQGRCAPAAKRVGGTCDAAQGKSSCADPNAQCVGDTAAGQAKCECNSGYSIERTSFACGVGTGSICRDENKTMDCATGLVCDFSGTCGVDVGQHCTGENRRWCKSGSVCEEGICKSDFKEDCSGENSKLCKTGTTCDTLNKCKFPVKSGCSSSAVCSAGAICVNGTCECDPKTSVQQGSTCAPIPGTVQGGCKGTSCNDPNAECTAKGICDCKPGFSVQSEDLTCKLALSQTCADVGGSCSAGTICDPDTKKCSLVLGEFCGGDKNKSCQTGAACDGTSLECKLDFKGNCSGTNIIHCKSGTFCDWTGECKLGTAQLCNTSTDCITGAKCVKSNCECETAEGSAYGDICAPKVGFVGGNCDDVGKCKAVGAQCKEGICRCGEGISTTETGFNCNTTASQSPDDTLSVGSAFLAALGTLAAGMTGCGALLFALLRRKKSRQDKVDEQMAAIAGEREELAEAVEESIALQEEAESGSVAEDEASSAGQGEGEIEGESESNVDQ